MSIKYFTLFYIFLSTTRSPSFLSVFPTHVKIWVNEQLLLLDLYLRTIHRGGCFWRCLCVSHCFTLAVLEKLPEILNTFSQESSVIGDPSTNDTVRQQSTFIKPNSDIGSHCETFQQDPQHSQASCKICNLSFIHIFDPFWDCFSLFRRYSIYLNVSGIPVHLLHMYTHWSLVEIQNALCSCQTKALF